MPYKTASQSGIPNTVFIFNKPIIASKIEGIEEIIKDRINGLLFEPNDYFDLAKKIDELYVDTDLYLNLINNIRNLPHLENLEWKEIATMTLDLYKKAIECK
jgi:glycosyltransferase involved in cell wall biosynthesis